MKNLFGILTFCTISLFFMGCPLWTDVPISDKGALPDRRIEGIWQNGEDAMVIQQLDNGSSVMQFYAYNDSLRRFEMTENHEEMRWTTLKKGSEELVFGSLLTYGHYVTFNILPINRDQIVFRFVEEQPAEAAGIKKDTSDVWQFGSSKKLHTFLKNNLNNPNLFDPAEQDTFIRRKDIFDLMTND